MVREAGGVTRPLDEWIWEMRAAVHRCVDPLTSLVLHRNDWDRLGSPPHVPLEVTLARLDATEQAAYDALMAAHESWVEILRVRALVRREQARQGLRVIEGDKDRSEAA
jgi:hypothetical protein